MKLFFEITTSQLVVSAGFAAPVTELVAKRGDGEYLALQLLRKGVPYEAPGGTELIFAAKKRGLYGSAALATAETWVWNATLELYEAAVNYEAEELDAMFRNSETPPEPYVLLDAEVAITRSGLGNWHRSQTVAFRLENNVWRGTEEDGPLPSAALLRPSVIAITSDVVNNNATANTLANVTGLQFPVEAGKTYSFRFLIPYTAPVTTTGSRWSINGPTFDMLAYRSQYTLTATTETTNYSGDYNTPSAANATSLAAGNVAIIEGVVKANAAGNVVARFASEVSGSAITAKAGANVTWCELPAA